MTGTKTNPSRLLPLLLGLIVGFGWWHFSSPDIPIENAAARDETVVSVPDDRPIRIDLIPDSDSQIDAPQDQSSPPSIPIPAVSEAMIVVMVSGLPSNQGKLRVAVFDSKTGFPNHKNAIYTIEFPLPEQNGEFRLEGLPAGDYAVAVYHDKNSDGTMNKGAFGIPTESYGFSNNVRGTFGPPKFSAAVRSFKPGEHVVDIEVK